MATPGISCVMPTTASRLWCIPLALRQFRRQTYDHAELVIATEDPDVVADAVGPSDRIQIVPTHPSLSLGAKFNAAVREARCDWIALWADDDWHHPDRLQAGVDLHHRADVIGMSWALFHDLETNETYIFRCDDNHRIGGTLVFARWVWECVPFPDRPHGVDTVWQYELAQYGIRRLTADDLPVYVAMQHGQTTGRPGWPQPGYAPYTGDLEALMGDDLATYCRAYARR